MKIPFWVKFFFESTHALETEFALLPPLNVLVDATYPDDPSRVVASYHSDWWNSPGGVWTTPLAYSEEETAAFEDWLELANEVCDRNKDYNFADKIDFRP